MDTKTLIKHHEAEVEKINKLLSETSARDFQNEQAATRWYKRLCMERDDLTSKITALKAEAELDS